MQIQGVILHYAALKQYSMKFVHMLHICSSYFNDNALHIWNIAFTCMQVQGKNETVFESLVIFKSSSRSTTGTVDYNVEFFI